MAQKPDYPRWPVALAVVAATALYVALPAKLIVVTPALRYIVPSIALLLLVTLTVDAPHRKLLAMGLRRHVSISLISLISLGNGLSLFTLLRHLLYGGGVSGRTLLYAAFDIWATNVIAFSLWYWELDGGGPVQRKRTPGAPRDLAFVQMTDPDLAVRGWLPHFTDYLYVAFTNASAFSPTDTLPLSRRTKLLMLVQASISIVTLLLVAARAVNILNS